MDEGDLHSSSIGIFAYDLSEGVHLELQLLSLRNTCASWNRFNVKVNGKRSVRIKCYLLGFSASLLLLDLRFFKTGNLRLISNCKLSVGRFDDKTIFQFYSHSLAKSYDLAS